MRNSLTRYKVLPYSLDYVRGSLLSVARYPYPLAKIDRFFDKYKKSARKST